MHMVHMAFISYKSSVFSSVVKPILGVEPGGGTFGWGCAARTLEPLLHRARDVINAGLTIW